MTYILYPHTYLPCSPEAFYKQFIVSLVVFLNIYITLLSTAPTLPFVRTLSL